jgi:hypothetical protein
MKCVAWPKPFSSPRPEAKAAEMAVVMAKKEMKWRRYNLSVKMRS